MSSAMNSCTRLQRQQESLGFWLFLMKLKTIWHLEALVMCQCEYWGQPCLFSPWGLYQRDGSFQDGAWGGLSQAIPIAFLKNSGVIDSIAKFLNISSDPATFIQAAIPQILENTKEDFFSKIISTLRECADICYNRIEEIPSLTCPKKPEGSMFVMVKLNLSMLEDINDDMDFCLKLAEEESVIVLPGIAVGLKNWLRITFAIEPSLLQEGLGRIKGFCQRHAKKQ
ncbi:hypothetical protein Gogos_012179 [Gossypium gossypioides]|uniref:Aminotransferase class I/classII large domain-containing protein n=1 Tax=Gossypium gossypioides TaxID=34282 RepID=A0A7J9BRQ7_GOSGO|nr:hypothetical protein [Gossypium gossypioides]